MNHHFFWVLAAYAFPGAFALFNRARGTKLFDLTSSTVFGRLASMFLMATLCAATAFPDTALTLALFAYTWAALMLWCSPAWDAYWSAEIGNDSSHSRLWGLGMMTLRMTLAMPAVIGDAIIAGHPERCAYAAGCLLLGLPYYVAGFFTNRFAVMIGELSVGGGLGCMFYATLYQAGQP